MANFTFTTNMKLKAINESVNSWFQEWLYNFNRLDTHDHTTGKGIQIPPGGLDNSGDYILGSLSFATSAKATVKFISRTTDPSSYALGGQLYVKGGELHFKDASANVVKITATGHTTPYYSEEISSTSTTTFTHGLGGLPDIIQLQYKMGTDDYIMFGDGSHIASITSTSIVLDFDGLVVDATNTLTIKAIKL